MTNAETADYSQWNGHEFADVNEHKVGKISHIYVDEHTGQPAWVTVRTGLFGRSNSFVPIQGTRADGDRLVSAWDKDKINDAPRVDDDGDGHLTPEEEQELYRHYGLADGGTGTAMTRSEEELRVGTETTETGRVRLRKYIVTENVTRTVPVSHEEVRIERVPIGDADGGATPSGDQLSEEEQEIVLHEQQPVIAKEVVAKETVRLDTETVSGEQRIDEQVRKERIDTEDVDPQP